MYYVVFLFSNYITEDDYNVEEPYIPVIIPDGARRGTFTIPITDDDEYEAEETFIVAIDPLSLPYGVTLGSNPSAIVTIIDDDSK